jgi:transposase
MRTSGDTLLRTIRRSRCSEHPTPRVLGVDDWSYRRGHRCGTILCDLERRQPVDLLPERSPECFSAWLDQHRGVEIITPDRGDAYLKGATVGAPQAVQVADRFHLVRNLREALCRVMERHSTDVQAALRTVSRRKFSALCGKSDPAVPIGEPSPTKPTPPEVQFQQQRRAERIQRYEQVVELHRQGVSLREIGRRLGLHRETAERFVRAGKYPERAPRMYRRGPDAYREYLQRRWEAGCCNALQLTRELRAQGFAGSYDSVRRYVAGWRTWQTAQPGIVAARAGDFSMQRPPVHRLVSWMLRHDRQLADDEAALVNILCEQCPDLRTAAELSREFETLLRNRQSVEFDQWLEKASAEHIPKPLRRFAAGLRNDLTAVRAAVTLPWSNGQVKGQVNRLKLIKRQMYGRANFDLLRQRVLFAG